MLAKMVVDQTHAVGLTVGSTSFKKIDAVGEVDGPGHSGAIVGDTAALALDRFGADQIGGRLYDCLFARIGWGRATAIGERGDRLTESLRRSGGAGAQSGSDK